MQIPTINRGLLALVLLSATTGQVRPQQLPVATASADLAGDRELLGLYIKLGETQRAKALGSAILKKYPNDRDTLILLGNLHLEKKEKEALRRIVQKLEASYPTNRDVRYLAASSHQLQKEYPEARDAFEMLKDEWQEGPFPYEQDLASIRQEMRDWRGAMESYKEMLASGRLNAKQRFEVRQALDEIYRAHLPRLEAEYQYVGLSEGTVQRSKANFSHDVTAFARVFVETRVDYVDQESEPGFQGRSILRSEGLVGVLWDYNKDWVFGGWLGAAEAYPLVGATLKRKLGNERIAQLEFSLYEKAIDSLLLETLDGRQSEVSLRAEGGISKDLYGGVDLMFREVVVDYESIGNGLMAEWYLEQVLWRAEPKITCAYHGALSLFNPNSEYDRLARKYGAGPANDPDSKQELITDYVQRHGISFGIEEDFSFGIVLRAQAGVEYAFELDSLEYNWTVGGSWFPKKSVELYTNVAFYSSAAESNQSSASIQMICGLKCYF